MSCPELESFCHLDGTVTLAGSRINPLRSASELRFQSCPLPRNSAEDNPREGGGPDQGPRDLCTTYSGCSENANSINSPASTSLTVGFGTPALAGRSASPSS